MAAHPSQPSPSGSQPRSILARLRRLAHPRRRHPWRRNRSVSHPRLRRRRPSPTRWRRVRLTRAILPGSFRHSLRGPHLRKSSRAAGPDPYTTPRRARTVSRLTRRMGRSPRRIGRSRRRRVRPAGGGPCRSTNCAVTDRRLAPRLGRKPDRLRTSPAALRRARRIQPRPSPIPRRNGMSASMSRSLMGGAHSFPRSSGMRTRRNRTAFDCHANG